MALVLADRVEQVTRTTGLADLELAEVTRGRQSFEDVTNNGDTVIYVLEDAEGTEWEIGVGTVVHGTETTLQRTTIRQSSDNDQKISLSAGTHRVFLAADALFLNVLTAATEANADAARETLLKRASLRGNFVENQHKVWPGVDGTSYPALGSVWTFARSSAATGWSFDVNETVASGEPRIITDPATNEILGILLEPARAKYGTYSETFDDASWTPASLAATATQNAYGFGGANTGWTITDASGAEIQRRAKTIAVPDDTATWTTSFYLLKEDLSNYPLVGVALNDPSAAAIQHTVIVDTATGEIKPTSISTGAAVVHDRGVFWQVDCTLANDGAGRTTMEAVVMPAFNSDFSTAVDAAATGSVVVAGFNAEVGESSTSYFKTEATAPLTRDGDSLNRALSSEFSQRYVTVFASWYIQTDSHGAVITLIDGGVDDWVILTYADGALTLAEYKAEALVSTTSNSSVSAGKVLNVAYTYDNETKELLVYANGVEAFSLTLTYDLATADVLDFSDPTGAGPEVQILRDCALAAELFAPAELGTLTTTGA